MKILIELPTWLGDTVMATPAIENIASHFKDVQIILVGSQVSIEALENNPKVVKTIFLEKTYHNFYQIVRNYGDFDLFFSFRHSFRSKLMKLFVKATKKYQIKKKAYIKGHQVEKYNHFINDSLNIKTSPGKMVLRPLITNHKGKNKLLGINPGASYGSAKRWSPVKFAKVAIGLSNHFDLVIFGGSDEQDIAQDIERCLIEKGISNYKNLAAKTSIKDLISQISMLDLFITGDSGPMHIAAALQVPTVAIFGPTKPLETSQWMNEDNVIVKKNLDCQPCMKRTCPLVHQNCMKLIEVSEVLNAVDLINY